MSAVAGAVGPWLVRACLLMVLWLALTDTKNTQDLVAGAVTAVVAATIAGLVWRPGSPRTVAKTVSLLRLGPRRLLHPLARLPVDTAILAAALARRLAGRRESGVFRAVRYRPDPPRRSAAGRALTETWGSLTPNRFVVGTDEEEGILLVHELVRTDQPLDPLVGR
jgi:hypothetical protein